MGALIVRVLAFCRKELSSSARQPLKVLGLVVGPFLILAIFAAGYVGKNRFDTALVVPQRDGVSTNVADYKSFSRDTFNITQVTTDKNAALNSLNDGSLNVVIVVPDDSLDQIYSGKSASFPVFYRQLNPLLANYIEYSTYVYASEFDKVLLRESLTAAKPQSTQLTAYTTQLNASVDRLENNMKNNQPAQARIEIAQIRALTGVARQSADSLIIPGAGSSNDQEHNLIGSKINQNLSKNVVGNLTGRLDTVGKQLTTIDNGIAGGDLNSPQQTKNVADLRQSSGELTQQTNKVAAIPPAVLVEPVLSKAQNLTNTQASFLNFYAPAVIILLLQHIGVTLSSLSIVRDRLLGAIEIFRVAPINPTEILIGKFLSYTILLMIVGGLLLAALNVLLGVPVIGDLTLVGLVLLSSTYASIGLGFLIAGLSRTETQAVQWSMLLILASIFFTGFIVPLTQFDPLVRYFSYILPMTFGVGSLQDLMLDNRTPSLFYLLMPVALGTVYFLVGRFLYKRQFSIS